MRWSEKHIEHARSTAHYSESDEQCYEPLHIEQTRRHLATPPAPTDNPIMERNDTAAELRRLEVQIALGAVRDGAQLLTVMMQLGDGLVVDLVPRPEDEDSDLRWRWRRRAS